MESVGDQMRLRYCAVLGKYRVTEIKVMPDHTNRVAIDVGNSCTMTMFLPFKPDLRVGDLLTLYTEMYPCASTN